MRINKKKIIEALRTEPNLKQRMWVEFEEAPVKGSCGVCAVGAVLRHAVNLRNHEIRTAVTLFNPSTSSYPDRRDRRKTTREALAHLQLNDWLGALSTIFESYKTDKAARRAAIAFVEKHFPLWAVLSDETLEKAKSQAARRLVARMIASRKRAMELLYEEATPTKRELERAEKKAIKAFNNADH